jgi:hypothetical protein
MLITALVPCNGSTHDVASDGASLLRRRLQVYSRSVDLQTDLMFGCFLKFCSKIGGLIPGIYKSLTDT